MSVLDVIAMVRDCLQDETVGLAAAVLALAPNADCGPEKIRVDFNFVKWKLSGATTLQPTMTPNVMLRPVACDAGPRQDNLRDSVVVIDIGIEWFDSDTDVLQDNTTIGFVALLAVTNALPGYSDAHGGTVIDVVYPIACRWGEFEGPSSAGFLATVQIQERSSYA